MIMEENKNERNIGIFKRGIKICNSCLYIPVFDNFFFFSNNSSYFLFGMGDMKEFNIKNDQITDTERLDFIQKHMLYVIPHTKEGFDTFCVADPDETGREVINKDLRKAIDSFILL